MLRREACQASRRDFVVPAEEQESLLDLHRSTWMLSVYQFAQYQYRFIPFCSIVSFPPNSQIVINHDKPSGTLAIFWIIRLTVCLSIYGITLDCPYNESRLAAQTAQHRVYHGFETQRVIALKGVISHSNIRPSYHL